MVGGKFRWHTESKKGAKRTYQYYSIGIGLEEPSPRQFSKIKKKKFEEVFMGRKLTFGEVLLDAEEDEELRQPRGRGTAYATARIAESPRVGAVEISYAEVRAMIDIPTTGRTHDEDLAIEELMPIELEDHVRDTAYAERRAPTADCRPPTADRRHSI